MSNIVERLDEIIAKNVALEIGGMSEAIKAHYRAAFCGETAAEIVRSNEELGAALAKATSEITRLQAELDAMRELAYCDTNKGPMTRRDLMQIMQDDHETLKHEKKKVEANLIKAEAELSSLKASAKEARAEALEEAAKAAERVGRPVGASDGSTYIPGTSAEAAAAIRRLKEGA